MRTISLAVIIVLAGLVAAPAATYYVDASSGDDARSGASLEAAWKTVQKANDTLVAGDTVYVRKGIYAGEWIRPSRSGTAEARITYAAYENDSPEITGGKHGSLCSLSGKSYITVRGFKLHSPTEHDWAVALAGEDCHHNAIEHCEVTDPDGYALIVIAEGASYNEVTDCVIHDVGRGNQESGDGIVMNSGAHHNTIRGNKVYNCCHSQIMALNGAHHNTIRQNDMYSTKRNWAGAGVNLPREADFNAIVGNRIHDLGYITNEKCAIQIDSSDNTIRGNLVYNVGAFGIALQSYKFRDIVQNAERNLIEENIVYNTGRQPIFINCKHGCISLDNRIIGNTFIAPAPAQWYGTDAWMMVFDTYHHPEPVEPGTWYGNVFEKNTFFHKAPGEADMVRYISNMDPKTKSWSIPELEAAYPKNFHDNREINVEFTAPDKGDFSLKAGGPLPTAMIEWQRGRKSPEEKP